MLHVINTLMSTPVFSTYIFFVFITIYIFTDWLISPSSDPLRPLHHVRRSQRESLCLGVGTVHNHGGPTLLQWRAPYSETSAEDQSLSLCSLWYKRQVMRTCLEMMFFTHSQLSNIKRTHVVVFTQSTRKQQHSMPPSACLLIVQIHSINTLPAGRYWRAAGKQTGRLWQ